MKKILAVIFVFMLWGPAYGLAEEKEPRSILSGWFAEQSADVQVALIICFQSGLDYGCNSAGEGKGICVKENMDCWPPSKVRDVLIDISKKEKYASLSTFDVLPIVLTRCLDGDPDYARIYKGLDDLLAEFKKMEDE